MRWPWASEIDSLRTLLERRPDYSEIVALVDSCIELRLCGIEERLRDVEHVLCNAAQEVGKDYPEASRVWLRNRRRQLNEELGECLKKLKALKAPDNEDSGSSTN